MVQYRTFRNTDPPHLVEVWNEAFPGRGAVQLQNSTPLESFVFAKPIFDPEGLIVAEEDGVLLGFGHAGMAHCDASPHVGVICMLGMRPSVRGRGVGTEILRRCEDYLGRRGATTIYAGPHWPYNPFYLGLYGGCDSPGFLTSDSFAEQFLTKHGYKVVRRTLVLQRVLDQAVRIIDTRFAPHRQRFQVHIRPPRAFDDYWQECVLGFLEPVEVALVDRQKEKTAARTWHWEMEGFSRRWNRPAVGILGFEVAPEWRRQGVGKFLLSNVLRQVQEQFFEIVEVHLQDNNQHAIQFVKSLAFEHVDTGQVFLREEK
ncbi:MAG: GNAT family N-acetyltransferase [Gemmataceae bacterium]|nr:GNAT family N-acetyltransferase [Gemmataceae bacterium]MCI0738618.1 GNAT family N-acetyltransferase [Gemmataceae bacterium]